MDCSSIWWPSFLAPPCINTANAFRISTVCCAIQQHIALKISVIPLTELRNSVTKRVSCIGVVHNFNTSHCNITRKTSKHLYTRSNAAQQTRNLNSRIDLHTHASITFGNHVTLTFWPRGPCTPSDCHALYNSSSRFSFRARTIGHTHTQMPPIPLPMHNQRMS